MAQERRKHTRYEIGNAVVIIPEGVYQIADISMGGFSFKCQSHISIPEILVTDIIEEIRAKKIWLSIYEDGNFNQFSLIKVGAKFGKLKKEQEQKLKKILQRLSTNVGVSNQ